MPDTRGAETSLASSQESLGAARGEESGSTAGDAERAGEDTDNDRGPGDAAGSARGAG